MTQSAAAGQPLAIEDIFRIETAGSPVITPDGRLAVYVRQWADRESDSNRSRLCAVGPDIAETAITEGPYDSSPAISPDGSTVAFLRRIEDRPQLCLVPIGGGDVRVLTELADGAGAPVWAGSDKIIFSAPVQPAPQGAADDHAPYVADRVLFKADGSGRFGERRHHLHSIDLGSGEVSRLTEGDWQAGTPSVSHDGSWIAFTARIDPDTDLEMTSYAYLVPISGGEPTRVGQASSVSGPLLWLPDDSAVVAVGMSEPGIGNARLIKLSRDGSADQVLTDDLDLNVMLGSGPAYPGAPPALTSDGRIAFTVRVRGWTHAYLIGVDGGGPTKIISGDQQRVGGMAVATQAPVLAAIVADDHSFGELVFTRIDQPDLQPVTELTATSLSGTRLLSYEQREFAISDGSTVHGWLLRDPATTGPAPLLLDVHGGPHNAWTGMPDPVRVYQQILAQRGWIVLTPNPRGSDGYGEAFMRGVVGGWGFHDQPDFLEPIDQLIAEGLVDPDRLAITGYSYGGFTTCHLTARTDRFAAAIAGGLLCDLGSQLGASDLGMELTQVFGDADPINGQQALLEASPISAVGQVSTPTLVLHGEDDHRCRVDQAERWFASLRAQRVPTRLVVYPGGAHGFILTGPPSQRADYNRRLIDWLDDHLKS